MFRQVLIVVAVVLMAEWDAYAQIKIAKVEKLPLGFSHEWSHPQFSPNGTQIYYTTLDGNGDGNPGDPFVLAFETRPSDVWAPQLISTSAPFGALLSSPNYVINLTFNEPLSPATVSTNNVVIQEVGGCFLSRTLEYAEANGKGAFNIYPTGGLVPGKSYRVRVSGVADLAGNAISATTPLVCLGVFGCWIVLSV